MIPTVPTVLTHSSHVRHVLGPEVTIHGVTAIPPGRISHGPVLDKPDPEKVKEDNSKTVQSRLLFTKPTHPLSKIIGSCALAAPSGKSHLVKSLGT